jgi:hypothetical protein
MRLHKALASLLIGAALGLVGCKTTELPPSSVYEILPGTWGWERRGPRTCEDNPHVISFSEDRTVMILSYAQPAKTIIGETTTIRYKIVSDNPRLRMLLEGERRRNPATDRLVLWDLKMTSPNRYCWRRNDWPPGSCTKSVVRCQTE